MADNFETPAVPRDREGAPLPLTPPTVALDEHYDATISASTAITLNQATRIIEVTAIDKGIFMKWGATATSSDFDEFIAAGSTRHYVVPRDQTSVQFIEEAASAKLVVIEK